MEDWNNYQSHQVKNDVDASGNRLISAFAKDYKSVFGLDICPNCNDFQIKFQNFLKQIDIMSKSKSKNSGYVLKKKYQNIPLGFGSPIYVNNDNMTDEYAQRLLKNHPRGKDLFHHIPDRNDENLSPVEQLVKDHSKDQLVEMASEIGIEKADGNKTEIATQIIAKQNEVSELD